MFNYLDAATNYRPAARWVCHRLAKQADAWHNCAWTWTWSCRDAFGQRVDETHYCPFWWNGPPFPLDSWNA